MVSDAVALKFVVAATANPRMPAPLTLPSVARKFLARAVKPLIAVAPTLSAPTADVTQWCRGTCSSGAKHQAA